MTLTKVKFFNVSVEILRDTEENLRHAGSKGMELFVLWSGVISGSEFQVRSAHVPNQTAFRLDSGLMVRVEGDALHQLNVWLHKNNETLAVQVHSHPTEAFHSDTDDTYPIVTAEGGISIVAADFCKHGLLSPSTAAYRFEQKIWRELNPPLNLFRVN